MIDMVVDIINMIVWMVDISVDMVDMMVDMVFIFPEFYAFFFVNRDITRQNNKNKANFSVLFS